MEGVVAVEGGLVRGVDEGALWVFRGVPYGGSTAGSRRWCRAAGPGSWTGIREAATWGPIAPQSPPVPGLSIPGDPADPDEDCLSLNIWTPGLDDRRRPVLVWIHGGGFTTGSGASIVYEGRHLATRGDSVVVTLNYRLGALGFLAHPELRAGGDNAFGNWGLHDQVAALGWLHEHIADFGGDPGNVTLFGESAGAMSIASLLASPFCGRLFHKVVLQSGPPATASTDWARRRAERLWQLATDEAASSFDRETLLRLSAEDLVRATQELAREVPGEAGLPLPLLPVVDGELISREPAHAVSDGSSESVPLLIGTTRDEAALFMFTDPSVGEMEMEKVVRRVRHVAPGDAADALVETYRGARGSRGEPTSPRDLLTAITTDYVFRLPSLALAGASQKHQSSTFAYLFTWESPFLGGVFGSSHGLDIPFVFGTIENDAVGMFSGSGPEASALSDKMQEAWLAFARNGDPSCEAVGEWPSYDPLRRPTMVLGGDRVSLEDDPRGLERLAWDEVGIEVAGGHHHDLRES